MATWPARTGPVAALVMVAELLDLDFEALDVVEDPSGETARLARYSEPSCPSGHSTPRSATWPRTRSTAATTELARASSSHAGTPMIRPGSGSGIAPVPVDLAMDQVRGLAGPSTPR
jgi:hypothetical protein